MFSHLFVLMGAGSKAGTRDFQGPHLLVPQGIGAKHAGFPAQYGAQALGSLFRLG